jgi:hypothetical protein
VNKLLEAHDIYMDQILQVRDTIFGKLCGLCSTNTPISKDTDGVIIHIYNTVKIVCTARALLDKAKLT